MMPATLQFELDAASTEEVLELASVLDKTPESIAREAFADGLHKLRRQRFYAENAGTVSAEEGLEILRSAGKGRTSDPGDELPDRLERLQYFSRNDGPVDTADAIAILRRAGDEPPQPDDELPEAFRETVQASIAPE